jgi:hypothetical protein
MLQYAAAPRLDHCCLEARQLELERQGVAVCFGKLAQPWPCPRLAGTPHPVARLAQPVVNYPTVRRNVSDGQVDVAWTSDNDQVLELRFAAMARRLLARHDLLEREGAERTAALHASEAHFRLLIEMALT